MRLKNNTALVTGAGRGIGKAIAIAFAKEGANLHLISRTEKELVETAKEISDLGQKASYSICDVSDENQVKDSINHAIEKFEYIDILINNAGLGGFRPIWGTRLNNWNRMLAVNLTSNFLFTKHIWKPMKSRRGKHHQYFLFIGDKSISDVCFIFFEQMGTNRFHENSGRRGQAR